MAAKRLRILCLHGYGQSGQGFRQRTGGLRKAASFADFVFIDGGVPLDEPALAALGRKGDDGDEAFGWWRTSPAAASDAPTGGWDLSLRKITQAIDEVGPVDGVFAFSQGAAFAAVLAALTSAPPSIQQEWGDAARATIPSFKFVILVSGLVPRYDQLQQLLESQAPITLPSLHVAGLSDEIIAPEQSKALAKYECTPLV